MSFRTVTYKAIVCVTKIASKLTVPPLAFTSDVYTDDIAGGCANMTVNIRSLSNGQQWGGILISASLHDPPHPTCTPKRPVNNIIVLRMLRAPPPTYLEKVPVAPVSEPQRHERSCESARVMRNTAHARFRRMQRS